MKPIPPIVIRQIFSLLLILLMGGLIFMEMTPYLSGILGAITLYVLFRKWMAKLVNKGWNPNWAAILIMFLSFILVLLPVGGFIAMLSNKIGRAVDKSESVIEAIKHQLSDIQHKFDYDLTSYLNPEAASSWITDNVSAFAGNTITLLISISIMYFLLFFMLVGRKELQETLFTYIPISKDSLNEIGSEVEAMVKSNALGIPLVALAQGIVALIGFFIFDVDSPFFWFVVVSIASMIPFIGAFAGILPVFILSLANGDEFQAYGILLYGLIVVGLTDNVIRLYALRKLDDVHPLITLIGVIIGVPLFGFIGLIFGPLLISLFLIMVRTYKNEYGEKVDTETRSM